MGKWQSAVEKLELIRRTFAGKRVFITGHTGFKGGWLSLWLQHLGAEVFGLALPPERELALFDLAGVARDMTSCFGDIRDLSTVRAAVFDAQPDLVFHLAAQPLVRASYRDPLATYSTNVMGTAHVLEALREYGGTRAAVIISSDKCYRNEGADTPTEGFQESDPMGGLDPYSSSKGCAELVTHAYRHSYFPPDAYGSHGLGLASARAGNVVGGGDWAEDRLVPDLIRSVYAGQDAIIRNPNAIRPWQHVLDPLWGYLLLAARLIEDGPRYAQGWNFGPALSDTVTVAKLADTLVSAWGDAATWKQDGNTTPPPHEATVLRLDCRKAQNELGWRPLLPLTEVVEQTVQWYRCWARKGDCRKRCLDEIVRHEKAIARLGES